MFYPPWRQYTPILAIGCLITPEGSLVEDMNRECSSANQPEGPYKKWTKFFAGERR